MLDHKSQFEARPLFDPADAGTGDTAIVSDTIDLLDANSVQFIVQVGSLADANATFAVALYAGAASDMSDEGSAITDAGLLIGTVDAFTFAADGTVVCHFGYRGNKRYVRVKITPSGNTGAVLYAGVVLLGKKQIGTV